MSNQKKSAKTGNHKNPAKTLAKAAAKAEVTKAKKATSEPKTTTKTKAAKDKKSK